MNTLDLIDLSMIEIADLIRAKRISPVEVTTAYLDRIEALDGQLHSFITVTAELALDQARQAEAELLRGETRQGEPLGRLHGVPIALKDLFETRGLPTTAGAKFLADYRPADDAAIWENLQAAGAILLGKTNLHEIALGLTSANPHYGAVGNPWMNTRVAGGSSGGSAAALAARLCPAAFGTDTGGSIRVPAALCGVAGLKPTFGRVSRRGVIPLSRNLDHVGPMARRVRDLALLLQIIAGYDPQDPYSVAVPAPDYGTLLDAGIADWKIALPAGDYFSKTDPAVQQIFTQAVQILEDLGARIEVTSFTNLYPAAYTNGRMVIADGAVFYADRLRSQPEDFGADIRLRLEMGIAISLEEYVQLRHSQKEIRRRFELFLTDCDLMVLPTTPVTAPPIRGPNAVEMAGLLTRYTAPFNLTGLPAVSIPCGFTAEGLPVGMQLVASPWQDMKVLQAAQAFESATNWHTCKPAL